MAKTKGIISAGHEKTCDAGICMLEAGGNAIDAAVAAAFMTFIADASLTTIAGAGYGMVHHGASGKNTLFDFFADMPGRNYGPIKTDELDFYATHLNFAGVTQEFHIGRGAAAVPGNVHGLLTMHEQYGRLPRTEILAPAIAAAKAGITLTKMAAAVFEVVRGTVMATSGTRALYAPEGTLLSEGDTFRNPELAHTMQLLARDGLDCFYRGEIGAAIADEIGKHGGLISFEDMAAYKTIARDPLSINYRGEQLLTNPAPALGGPLIAFTLELISSVHFSKDLAPHSKPLMQVMLEAMRLTNDARAKHDHLSSDVVELYRGKLIQKLNKGGAWKPAEGEFHDPKSIGNTTHLSVIDEEHNAVSLTTSHGEGNGICVPGTGIVLNNLLGEEDINPKGFHAWNPGDRLASMMTPTMILKGGAPHIVLGSAGSNRIRSAILQVITQMVDAGADIETAVNGPRMHWERGQLNVEPGFFDDVTEALRHREPNTVLWNQTNLFFGGAHCVQQDPKTGAFAGAGDHRRGGSVRLCT